MLTPRQRELLEFIEDYGEKNGYYPTHDEMIAGTGITHKSHINQLLMALEGRGYIIRMPRKSRAIEVIRRSSTSTYTVVEKAMIELLDELEAGVVGGPAYGRAHLAISKARKEMRGAKK